MAADIPVLEESLQCMILFPTLTPSVSQGHLKHKFTFTSRKTPAPPLLLKLFLKSSSAQTDWAGVRLENTEEVSPFRCGNVTLVPRKTRVETHY